MCLAVPGRVVKVRIGEPWAVIEAFGVKQKVGTQLVGEVAEGDYLMIHAGYAIEKLDMEIAQEQIRFLKELLR
ncbi:HypC/HybG/HupF family hydrogenase formation chaperone [Desulfotomaculum defluvii]